MNRRPNEIYNVGTVVNIVQSLKLPDGNIKVLVEGVERAKVVSVTDDEGFFRAVVRTFNYKIEPGPQLEALRRPRHHPVRAVRQAQPEPELRNHDRGHPRGRSRQAFRYRWRQPAAHHRREAGTARNFRSHRPADPRRRDARHRNREAQCRPHHPGPREAPDGKGAKRVLPQREDQGDPEGTGPRRKERNR